MAPTPLTVTTPMKWSHNNNENNNGANLNLVVLGSHNNTNSEVLLEETTPVSLASPDGFLNDSHSSSPLFSSSSRHALDFEDADDSDDDIL